MCLRNVQFSMLNKCIPNPLMRPFQGPITILMLKRTVLAGEITWIPRGTKIIMITHGQTTTNIPIIITILPIINSITITILPIINLSSNYQPNFPNHAPQSSFQSLPLEKKIIDFEKTMERYMRDQESLIQTLQNNIAQAITRLEVQIGQLANSQNERPKGTLWKSPRGGEGE